MKRLSKAFLVLGVLALIFGGFTGCSNGNDNGGGSGEQDQGQQQVKEPVTVDFTQTVIPASENTYPAKAVKPEENPGPVVNPEIVDSKQTITTPMAVGKVVTSPDKLVTVTPRSDGLYIQVNYDATEESKTWQHSAIRIQNVTDEREVLEVTYPHEDLFSEFLYKYTEKDKVYEVWVAHQGSLEDEWDPWGETRDTPAHVKAIGGYGEIDIRAENLSIKKGENDSRIFSIENFYIARPSSVFDGDFELTLRRVRVERGGRWEKPDEDVYDLWKDFEIDDDKFTITYEEGENKDFIDFIDGQKKMFILLNCKFSDGEYEYNQEFFQNWDNWIKDDCEPTPIPEHQFPLIKIVSTENDGYNGFIKEPIAHHVKDAQQGWGDFSNVNTPDPYYEVCTIAVDDGAANKGKVKVRGNWTTSYDKKSLRIKFDEKLNMCGLHNGKKFKNWVLLAVWKDASFLRDATALKMFKDLFGDEYYSSDSKLVEVEVNGEYLGVYLLAEQQQTNKNRVNITEPEENSAETKIGYLIEFDQYYTSEIENERFEINYGGKLKDYAGREIEVDDIQKGYTIKSDVYSADQKDFIMKYMNRLWTLCYDAVYNKRYFRFTSEYTLEEYTPEGANDDEKCKNCISEVIDVKSLANMYIYNELVCDPDLYLTSFFMDVDFADGKDHKLRFEAPWDFDSTMGNKSFAIADTSNESEEKVKENMSTINELYAGNAQTDVNCKDERNHVNPWMVIFINQTWFQKLVKAQWAEIDTATVLSGLQGFIDQYSAGTYSAVFDYTRELWDDPSSNIELCEASRKAAATSQAVSAGYLKEWLTARFGEVDTIIKGLE